MLPDWCSYIKLYVEGNPVETPQVVGGDGGGVEEMAMDDIDSMLMELGDL